MPYEYIVMIGLTFDHNRQKTQIKCFTSRAGNRVHAFNGLISLMNCPNCSTLAPNEKLWEILIKIIMSFSFNRLQILIGFEPPGQLSVLGIVEYILNLIFSVENHRVTTRKMDSQMIYSWSFHMHRNSMILWQT